MTPWFPLYPRDFLAATAGWTAEERGHYTTLLMIQWEQGGLPDDPKRLELISPGLKGCWKTIAEKFPVWKDGKRRNTRLEHERSKSHERSERARQSASQRWALDAMSGGDQPADPSPPVPGDEQSERICERMCDSTAPPDASIAISSSPPSPPVVSAAWEQEWPALRLAWNTEAKAGKRAPWRSAQPPANATDRLRESGWLDEAMKAIAITGELRQFDSPVTLGQFCQPGWVAKVLGGYFRDPKRAGGGNAGLRPGADERRTAAQAAAEWKRAAADPDKARQRSEYLEAKARKRAAAARAEAGRKEDADIEVARAAVLDKLRQEASA